MADRFHLLKNLRERLKEVMDRKQSCLPEVEDHASDAIPAKAQGSKDKSVHEPPEQQAEPEAEKHYRTIPPYPYQRPAGVSYKAAFSSEWSQGQVEAQVNCLKLQKRIVFGRANFDLLRLRVLSRV